MQGIEQTLRETLAKLGTPELEARQKLYRATGDIFERSLSPYLETHPQMVAERRQELRDIIDRIEQEFAPSGVSNVQQPEPAIQAPNVTTPAATNEILNEVRPQRQSEPTPQAEFPHSENQRGQNASAVNWPDINPAESSGQQGHKAMPVEVPAVSRPDNIDPASRVAPVQNDAPRGSEHGQVPQVPLGVDTQPVAAPAPQKEAKKSAEQPKKQKRTRREKRGLRLLNLIAGSVVTVIFLTFLAVGAWLLVESEYYQMFLDWRNGTENTQVSDAVQNDADFVPKPLTATSSEQSSDWIEVFGFQNASTVQGRGEVIVDQIGGDGAGGVRITSVNASEFGEAIIPLNARILSAATSNKIALAIALAVEEPTQIYVRCVLKDGTETTRRRFQLDGGPNEIIIDLDLTRVSSLNSQPFIAINSDISGNGRPVDLFRIDYQILR